jgi:hypothetical protein
MLFRVLFVSQLVTFNQTRTLVTLVRTCSQLGLPEKYLFRKGINRKFVAQEQFQIMLLSVESIKSAAVTQQTLPLVVGYYKCMTHQA